jgi:hypothetical protein
VRENFGEIRIRWAAEPLITLCIRDLEGEVRLETSFPLADLTFTSP